MDNRTKKQRELFERFTEETLRFHSLKGIVQNPDVKASEEELREWEELANIRIKQLKVLVEEVVRFYRHESEEEEID